MREGKFRGKDFREGDLRADDLCERDLREDDRREDDLREDDLREDDLRDDGLREDARRENGLPAGFRFADFFFLDLAIIPSATGRIKTPGFRRDDTERWLTESGSELSPRGDAEHCRMYARPYSLADPK
jgi:hypothetical protein